MLFLWVLYLAEPQAPFLPLPLYTAFLVHPAPANSEAEVHNGGQDGAKPLPQSSHQWADAIAGASCAKPVPCQEVFGSLEPTQIFPAMQTDQDTALGVGASCLGAGLCGVSPSTLSL